MFKTLQPFLKRNFSKEELLSEKEKCGRKTCTSNREDYNLERIVKESRFKNWVELYKELTEAGDQEPPYMCGKWATSS